MKQEKKPGRPAFEPTQRGRDQVKMMAGMGIPDYEICKVIGVSEPTMRKHFWQELETGHIVANSKVAQSLFKMATDKDKPNVTAAIFWLKTRARWTEAQPAGAEPPGKKEQAAETAKSAHHGTGWADLLSPPAGVQ